MLVRIGLFSIGVLHLLSVSAATVSDVTARQRWPWNGLVDIDYTITGDDTENTAIAVKVTDTDTGKIYTPTNFLEVPPTAAGRHRITWSTEADKLDLIATNVVFEISLLKYVTPPVRSDLYCVIDLSGGPEAEKWPVSYLSAVPEGGWTDEYKTTKLVLRRIEKGAVSGMENPFNDTFRFESITNESPYYIGVFEVTSAQFKLITGNIGKTWANYGDKRPQRAITYDTLRGAGIGVEYPETDVKEDSVIGILKAKTSLSCELPTEAQWEFACRAGTTSLFNNGGSTEDDLKFLGRFFGNRDDYKGGFGVYVTTVGSYQPNRWGLYDMHGNVEEWCLDWDVKRNQSPMWRVIRGGNYGDPYRYCTSGWRWGDTPDDDSLGCVGFRLCVNLM